MNIMKSSRRERTERKWFTMAIILMSALFLISSATRSPPSRAMQGGTTSTTGPSTTSSIAVAQSLTNRETARFRVNQYSEHVVTRYVLSGSQSYHIPNLPAGLSTSVITHTDNNTRLRISGTPVAEIEQLFEIRLTALNIIVGYINIIVTDPLPTCYYPQGSQNLKVTLNRVINVPLPYAVGSGTYTYGLPTNWNVPGLQMTNNYVVVNGIRTNRPYLTGLISSTRNISSYIKVMQNGITKILCYFTVETEVDTRPRYESTSVEDSYVTFYFDQYQTISLDSAVSGNLPITYSVNRPIGFGLSYSSSSNSISGIYSRGSSTLSFQLIRVTATDRDGDSVSKVYVVHAIADTLPTFGDISSVTHIFKKGVNSNAMLPTATGGNGTHVYSLRPALPPGLEYNAVSNSISGSPTTFSPRSTFTLYAYDDDFDVATYSFELEVTLNIFSDDLESYYIFFKNTPVNQQIISTRQVPIIDRYISISPSLPRGLTLSTSLDIVEGIFVYDLDITGTPLWSQVETEHTITYRGTVENRIYTESFSFILSTDLDRTPGFGDNHFGLTYGYNNEVLFVGEYIDKIITTAYGGNGNLTATVPNLPSGLSIYTKDHPYSVSGTYIALRGTPVRALSYSSLNIIVRDYDGDSATWGLRLIINDTIEIQQRSPSYGYCTFENSTISRTIYHPTIFGVGLKGGSPTESSSGNSSFINYTITPLNGDRLVSMQLVNSRAGPNGFTLFDIIFLGGGIQTSMTLANPFFDQRVSISDGQGNTSYTILRYRAEGSWEPEHPSNDYCYALRILYPSRYST